VHDSSAELLTRAERIYPTDKVVATVNMLIIDIEQSMNSIRNEDINIKKTLIDLHHLPGYAGKKTEFAKTAN